MAADARLAVAREYVPTMIEAHRTVPPTVMSWATALDNHEPPRAFAYGYAVSYLHNGDTPALILWDDGALKDPERCNYAVDDGHTVRIMYVAGWGPTYDRVYLHAFPTNPDGRTATVHGQERVIDFDTWMLGPRKTYHVKVRPVPDGVE